MAFWQSKSDLEFTREFQNQVAELWRLSDALSSQESRQGLAPNTANPSHQTAAEQYSVVRTWIAKHQMRAERIARQLGVPIDMASHPLPAVGGVIIQFNLIEAILNDTSYGGVSRQVIIDAIHATESACEGRVEVEFRKLFNPLAWMKALFIMIIRIPFSIVSASGFDVSKFEDHFLAKLFKLAEAIALIYILFRLGVEKEELVGIVRGLLPGNP